MPPDGDARPSSQAVSQSPRLSEVDEEDDDEAGDDRKMLNQCLGNRPRVMAAFIVIGD